MIMITSKLKELNSFKNKFSLLFFLFIYFFTFQKSNSQVLISLLFGDKLNSENLEFGLEGGFNQAQLRGLDQSKSQGFFHLGFYFDIRMKNDLWLNTGVRIKSNAGAMDIPTYSLLDPELDAVFTDGTISRRLGYFYVPVHLKYRLGEQKKFFVHAGGQIGLRNKASDEFLNSFIDQEDASFLLDIREQIRGIDTGLSGGIGYKLGKNGMSLGLTYYHGLVNIMKESNLDPYDYSSQNSNLYLFMTIPVGAGKKEANTSQ
ncbi:porin family protein [uncultured Algoriphagus sp.]|uniref:porin family protein n=1 Tax=uncultured Algoriphagus sp. TaxID=417365 RepID=UPI0025963160|nr:porin family protein [uncultured Algoriphagus sp.]